MKTKLTNLLKITLAVCGMLLLSNSCTKKEYEEIYIDNPTQWDVIFTTVKQNEWKWDNKGEFYYCEKSIKELTNEKTIYGVVSAYREFENEIFKQLENTEYYYDNGYFSETVGFDYSPGKVFFYVKASDLFDKTPENFTPLAMDFKITILYNQR